MKLNEIIKHLIFTQQEKHQNQYFRPWFFLNKQLERKLKWKNQIET